MLNEGVSKEHSERKKFKLQLSCTQVAMDPILKFESVKVTWSKNDGHPMNETTIKDA